MKLSKQIIGYMQTHKTCEACGQWVYPRLQPHHIQSRGAGGNDSPMNLLRLCLACHYAYHKRGALKFIEQYPHLKDKIMKARPLLRAIEMYGGKKK